MNATQLAKMRAGRERQLEQQREESARRQADYEAWIKYEHVAFTKRAAMIEQFGRTSDEFHEADSQWHKVLAAMPTTSFAWS